MIRAFSYGGGVQSTAALVLAAQRKIDPALFVFANTGDDSEHPATLDYLRKIAMPYAEKHGLELVERKRPGKTLYEHTVSPDNRSIAIPARMDNGAPGNRKCTDLWKIKVVSREVKQRGASNAEQATVGIGISRDEWHRAKDSRINHIKHDFPLMNLSRRECVEIIEKADLPVPPKSACFFCPYKKKQEWKDMNHKEPELFKAACTLEEAVNKKRASWGKDALWLSQWLMPLADCVTDDRQLSIFGEDEECSGYCWT